MASNLSQVQRTQVPTLTVATTPARGGVAAQLQRWSAGTWHAVITTVLSAHGAAIFHPTLGGSGSTLLRVVVPRTGDLAAAASRTVPVTVLAAGTTFGQLMHPESTAVVPRSQATYATTKPTWAGDTLIRWDRPNTFTSSQAPEPAGTLLSAADGRNVANPASGAEYNDGNSSLQTADVSFVVTGRRFAIKYGMYQTGNAMVWIDGHPLSASPISARNTSVAAAKVEQQDWIQVDLRTTRTVSVRFAGPVYFTGISYPAAAPVTVTAAPAPFTLGVVSDSYYDSGTPAFTYGGSGAAVLNTDTGFRIWDMAQGGTGYVNDGTGSLTGDSGDPGHYASPFGSSARIAGITRAPIDALLVNGSANDVGYSLDGYVAAVTTFLDRIAEVRPDLPVVIVGVEPTTFADQPADRATELTAEDDALRQLAQQHTNVVGFIDPLTEHWLTGTGSTAVPEGDGNQDTYIGTDRIHLSPAGQAYYQRLVASHLSGFVATPH
jgi:hypothetical protein